ncbi:MAG: 6,7-dimethyl-8-ribityllumazine synthase [Dehalococcoidia bacterium]|nr:6,7-dimethyl-8-ribityllumazine synthase [Dehalococcoidia bacterium]
MVTQEIIGSIDGKGLRIGIAIARFNGTVTRRLLKGALNGLRVHNMLDENISIVWVPGSLELAIVVREMALSGEYDGLIALGCVIRGDTTHYDVVVEQSSSALGNIPLETGIPVVMGVLTVENLQQALSRSGDDRSNKGYYCSETVLEMANLMNDFKAARSR